MSNTSVSAPAAVATWFEIPAENFERAVTFYETVLTTTLTRGHYGQGAVAVFPHAESAVTGAVVDRPGHSGATGPIVYIDAGGPLDDALARVRESGGRVGIPKTPIGGEMGYFAVIVDTEGNRVGLHAMS